MIAIHKLIDDAIQPGHFWVRPDLMLTWQPPIHEAVSWEIFRGRLLDPAHTRQSKAFTSWSIFQLDGPTRSTEPLLSVKLDEEAGAIHVVRAVLTHVWVGADIGSNVIESREAIRWVRELVGTISLDAFNDPEDLSTELMDLLRAAVQGTSQLPLTSVEAPLPAFSLGQLAYLPAPRQDARREQPLTTWQELASALPDSLETLLRTLTPDQAAPAARLAADAACRSHFPRLLRELFTQVSLSPYTQFVDTTMAFVKALAEQGTLTIAEEVDLWGGLLRQLGRHLTAYDLVTFHYRGANYPDALLLDTVLKRFGQLIDAHAALFEGQDNAHRLRRRALRQGCLLRRHYEGHPVPDAPTSPGENARVLPAPFVRVPEEQLLNVLRRRRRLYANEPLSALLSAAVRKVLAASIHGLVDPREWRELGMALFIDRPFGWGKEVGEPDLTPLLAHEAYSPGIARRRFLELERLAGELDIGNINWELARQHETSQVPGLPVQQLAVPDRPMVSLADARRVADDFVILRTLPRGLREVLQSLDFGPLRGQAAFFEPLETLLLVRLRGDGNDTVLACFDGGLRKRLEMRVDISAGFLRRSGREMPAAGVRVVRVWDERGKGVRVDIEVPVV